MTYEEAVKKASRKLVGWEESGLYYGTKFRNRKTYSTLDVNLDSFTSGPLGLVILTLSKGSSYVLIDRVESMFKDPFNITLEEASLFKLEYGVNYPKELVNG